MPDALNPTPDPATTKSAPCPGARVAIVLVCGIVAAAFVLAFRADLARHAATRLALAGTSERAARLLHPGPDIQTGFTNAVDHALAIDTIFVVAWIVLIPCTLSYALRFLAPRYRTGPVWQQMVWIAVAAGGFDAIENALTWWVNHAGSIPSIVPPVLATIGWTKFLLYGIALVGVLGMALGPAVHPLLRGIGRALYRYPDRWMGKGADARSGSPTTESSTPSRVMPSGPSIGICVSGGGIRAAGFALGALRGLDRAPTATDRQSIFRRARWLAAVSGGAYAATGWMLARRTGEEIPPQPGARDGLFDKSDEKASWSETVKSRSQYLRNGKLGFTGGLFNAAWRTVLVVGVLASLTVFAGALIGAFVRSPAMYPGFPNSCGRLLTFGTMIGWDKSVPGLALIAIGLAVLAYAGSFRESRSKTPRAIALALLGGGAALLAVLVVMPIALRYGPTTLSSLVGNDGTRPAQQKVQTDGASGAGILALLSTLGILGAVAKLIVTHVSRRALRLGGLLLGILAVILAGKVANDVAFDQGALFTQYCVYLIAVGFIIVFEAVPAHRQTLQGVYRKRLAGTFALGQSIDADGYRTPLAYDDEGRWPAYATHDLPELLICATAHSSSLGLGGVKAHGFTFRPAGVTMYDSMEGTFSPFEGPTGAYPTGSGRDGFPRGWIPTRSMAITGAAFASAMARQGLGTTNALLVALNLRLGCWVPNPRFVADFTGPTPPRVHMGYLLKELFGKYHPDRDPFVYVADGGHRDNLGLIELLRQPDGPRHVFVVDASGDTPGEFTTLREGIEMARVELGVTITIDLEPLRSHDTGVAADAPRFAGGPRDLPSTCTTTGTIRYPDGRTARLYYGRNLVDASAAHDLVQYAADHAPFPNFSTGNQFLHPDEFDHLVTLGEHVGAKLRTSFGE